MTSLGKSKTIWMNVTTSATWNRPAVGIVRVEQAICIELEKIYGNNFKRCIWNGSEFIEWQEPYSGPQDMEPIVTFDAPFPTSQSFDLLRCLFSTSADTEIVRSHHGITTEHKLATTSVVSKPKFGDVLISVGLDWDHSYSESFYKTKNKDGVYIISCCYDLIPVLFPQYCVGEVAKKFKEYFTKLTWGSSSVLCISEQTKRDYENLCKQLGTPKVPTEVIPLGDNLPVGSEAISDQISNLTKEPFLIFVSTIERRKNHEILYRAYHLLCRQGHRDKLPKMIFVGMPGWGVGDFLKDIELDPLTQGLIVQLNHVNDAELAHLYEKALFCAYPSLYEGWGLPVGEALAMGKAVIASDQGSLPEVGGDLVRYVDPWNASAWADTFLDLLSNPKKIKSMEARARQFYSIRKWSGTSRVITRIIDDMDIGSFFPMRFEPGYDMSTYCGIHHGSSIVSTGDEGLLMFGPHRSLPPGSYQLVIQLRYLENWVGNLEFRIASAQGSLIHSSKFLDGPQLVTDAEISENVQIDFRLADFVDDFEVVCISRGRVHVAFELIELKLSSKGFAVPQETSTKSVKSYAV